MSHPSDFYIVQQVAEGQPISAANDEAVFGLLSPALVDALEAVNQVPSLQLRVCAHCERRESLRPATPLTCVPVLPQLPSVADDDASHPGKTPMVPLVAMRYREEYKNLLSASLVSLQRKLQAAARTHTTDAAAQHGDAHPEL